MCGVQTRLADRSALFTFLALRIRQSPAILRFLYRLGSPSGGAESVLLGLLGDDGPQLPDVAPRFDLNAAIVRALAHDVRQNGAELMLPAPATNPIGVPDPTIPDGVPTFSLATDLIQPEFHFEHDGHFNALGHEHVARQLAPFIAERIRAKRARSSPSGGVH
jgi:hypothetical protein